VVDFLRAFGGLFQAFDGKEMLSPFFLLQNSIADWGSSAERMPWASDAWLLSSTCSLLFPFQQKKMHLIKGYQHMWL